MSSGLLGQPFPIMDMGDGGDRLQILASKLGTQAWISFFGPEPRWVFRSDRISLTIAFSIRQGQLCGRRLRSSRPPFPSSLKRLIFLWAVFREMLKAFSKV